MYFNFSTKPVAILLLIQCFVWRFSFSQNLQTLVPDQVINSFSVDSVNNKIYVGGKTSLLYAQDGLTGNILTYWTPTVRNGISDGEVRSVLSGNDTIYIGGTFNLVNNISRLSFSALDGNGNILSWNPGAILNQQISVNDMIRVGHYIYVACDHSNTYGSGILIINALTGDVQNDSAGVNIVSHDVYKLQCSNDTLYALTEGGFYVCKKRTLEFVKENDEIANYNNSSNSAPASDFTLYGNKLYFTGDFQIGSQQYGVLAYDLKTNTRDGNWIQQLVGTCPVPTYPDIPDPITTALISTIIVRDSTLLIGGFYLRDHSIHNCSDIFSIMNAYPNMANSLSNFTNDTLWGSVRYNVRQFKIVGSLLYSVSTRKTAHPSGTYYLKDAITVHCLIPEKPKTFTIFSSPVCPKSDGITYAVPASLLTTYLWSYSGTGVTINSQGTNSTTLDFSANAIQGMLQVIAQGSCGLLSEPQAMQLKMHPVPNAFAGVDGQIDCRRDSVLLIGKSDTTNVSYSWKLPSTINLMNDTMYANTQGNYLLTVTKNTTGCYETDTLTIKLDKTKPVPQILTPPPYSVTCKNYNMQLVAGSDAAADSFKWYNGTSTFFDDTIKTNQTKTRYKLYVTKFTTGCIDTISVYVDESTTKPSVPVIITPNPILTCKDPITTLKATTADSLSTTIVWIVKGDTLPNPALVDSIGFYDVNVIDTTTGCLSAASVYVGSNTQKPGVSASSKQYITCSSNTIVLNDSSITPHTILTWSGPNSFSAMNPTVVGDTGIYVLSVKDSLNGCVATKNVEVELKPWLLLKSSADTLVCYGSSATLIADPIGGTEPFEYKWEKGNTVIGVATQQHVIADDLYVDYVVNINDNAGCTGIDTIRVNRATVLRDSVVAIQPCDPANPSGQLQVFASGSVAPYSYSINSGAYQQSSVFQSLNFGLYNLSIRDSLGCTLSAQVEISTTSLLPQPNFLVATNLMKGDTFVVVDISNPKPDKILWSFPVGSTVIDSAYLAPVVVCPNTGNFTIVMNATFGSCEMSFSKTIHIVLFDTTYATSKNENGIEHIMLSPNPNDGHFTVDVKLYKKQTFVVLISDAAGVEQYKQLVDDSDHFNDYVTLNDNGTYILKVISEYDSDQRTFVVIK